MSSLALLLALALGTMKADPNDAGCILVEIVEELPAPPCDCVVEDPPIDQVCICPGAWRGPGKHLHWLQLCDPEKMKFRDGTIFLPY